MNTCGATRLLLVGFLAGTLVSWITGSDLAGWLAVGATVAATAVVRRARGTTTACPVPARADVPTTTARR